MIWQNKSGFFFRAIKPIFILFVVEFFSRSWCGPLLAHAVPYDCYVVVEGDRNSFITYTPLINSVWMQEMLGGWDEVYHRPKISGPFELLGDGRPIYIGGTISSLRLYSFDDISKWGYRFLAPYGWGTFARIYVDDYNALVTGASIRNYMGTLPFGSDPSKLYPRGCVDIPPALSMHNSTPDTGRQCPLVPVE